MTKAKVGLVIGVCLAVFIIFKVVPWIFFLSVRGVLLVAALVAAWVVFIGVRRWLKKDG